MFSEAGQPEVLKRQNRQLILSFINNEKEVSRATLARRSGLSRTTISNIIKELIGVGLIKETGDLASSGGRPGTRLELTHNQWFAMGAELRNQEWIIVLISLQAEIIQRKVIPVNIEDPISAIGLLCEGLLQLKQQCPGRLLPAIGLGVPGIVDQDGVILQAVDLGWRQVAIGELVSQALDHPVYVMNRSRTAGLAEARYGAGRGAQGLIYIGIGTGISAAIFIKGVLYSGVNSSSGELGHVTVQSDGPLCTCGNRGCLSMLASEQAILEDLMQRIAAGGSTSLGKTSEELARRSGADVCRAAQTGDALALSAIQKVGVQLGIAIANLINILNPDTVVIGGPIGQCGEPLLGFIRDEVSHRAHSHPRSALDIVVSSLGANSGAIGAATLVLDQKLSLIFSS